jgi:branched-subunit amino acid transport protein
LSVWLAMLGMGAVTLALRVSFLLMPERIQLPAWTRRALRFVPAAVLTAIWAPELLLQKGVLSVSPDNEKLLAGVAAIAVAWRWRLSFATIVAGLLALHFFDWLI